MKNIFVFLFFLFIFSYTTAQKDDKKSDTSVSRKEKKIEEENDEEWEVVVFDGQYESFISSRALPRNQYSESTLKMRNQQLVQEWNSRVISSNYNRDIYESQIEYDSNEKYGFEFEYRLYQFFAFVSWKFGEKFIGLSQRDFNR